MEVVLQAVSEKQEPSEDVNEGWSTTLVSYRKSHSEGLPGLHTHGGWLAAEVSCLITAEEALWLDSRRSSPGKLFIEANYSLHASRILGSTDGLFCISKPIATKYPTSSEWETQRFQSVAVQFFGL